MPGFPPRAYFYFNYGAGVFQIGYVRYESRGCLR